MVIAVACFGCRESAHVRIPGDSGAKSVVMPSVSAASAPAASDTGRPGSPTTAVATCPDWGDWQRCSVENRLTAAGLVIEARADPVRLPFMHVPGTVYGASNAEIQVFLYPSAAERAKDTDALDSSTVSPRGGSPVVWKEPATLVVSNNLAAIVLSLNGRQTERITDALGAGMPLHKPGR